MISKLKLPIVVVVMFLCLPIQSQKMKYLALGDSYTIGEEVAVKKNWPNRLVKFLNKDGFEFAH